MFVPWAVFQPSDEKKPAPAPGADKEPASPPTSPAAGKP
jgi:hypothetical protein